MQKTTVVLNGTSTQSPSEPSPTGAWELDVNTGEWTPYEKPQPTPHAVHTYLHPFIEDYQINTNMHRMMCDRARNLEAKGCWTSDDSHTYKQINTQAASMLADLHRAEDALGLALGVLVAIYGREEASRLYPDLWSVAEVK